MGEHWFLARCAPVIRDGQITEALFVATEITAQKRTETALRAAESRLSLALEAGKIGTWEWDVATGRLAWDARQLELFGLAPDRFDQSVETFLQLVHPDDRERLRAETELQRSGFGRSQNEFRIVRPDGGIRWLVGDGLAAGRRRGWGLAAAARRDRHRRGGCSGGPEPPVPAVSTARGSPFARRHRARPRDLPAAGRADARECRL